MNKLRLIIVCGLPCVGKSTVAEGISKKLKMPVFSVDPIESAIIKSGIERSFETGLAAYLVCETLAAEQLKLGSSAIIDAVSGVKESKEMWRNLAQKYKAKLVICECVLDEAIHRNRVEARVRNMHGIEEVTWEYVQNAQKEYVDWKEKRLILDTAKRSNENLKKVLEYIWTK